MIAAGVPSRGRFHGACFRLFSNVEVNRMHRTHGKLLLAIFALLFSSCPPPLQAQAPLPPTIAGIVPVRGGMGTTVTLIGVSFGSTQGASTVTFNGIPAHVFSARELVRASSGVQWSGVTEGVTRRNLDVAWAAESKTAEGG